MRKINPMRRAFKRAYNESVTADMLNARATWSQERGYPKQKWIQFCETMLADGFSVSLYEAQKTFSKYVTVSNGKQSFKVRFSNHRPIKRREEAGDCDFFVGVCNHVTHTTEQAVAETRAALRAEAL